MASPHVIDFEWLKTPSSMEYVDSLLHHGKRRHFGLLERPSLPPHKSLDSIKYKIFLVGKSGVGKSATVAKLAGCKVSKAISETAGIESTMVYWPARIIATGQILFFQLHFWDVGETAIKKFDHILSTCESDVDCVLFTFSFTDRSSFSDVPSLLSTVLDGSGIAPVRILLGTKADQFIYSDISDDEIADFSQTQNIPFLKIKNIDPLKNKVDGRESIHEIAPFMNRLCDLLMQRDQILANKT